MLELRYPLPVKFICGFIYSREETYQSVKNILIRKYGDIDFESEAIEFTYTDYYCPEMGKPLWRRFVSFQHLQDSESFVAIKLYAIRLEKKFARNKKRSVNIDPGYLTEAKLVLTTTKDYSHRIYLGRGIFAEVTLSFREGSFCDFPFTFPDYRTARYKEILTNIRHIYQQQLLGYK